LKCSASRRSADNITAVAITFDNFYKVLDSLKPRNHQTILDYDVIEMQKMEPLQPHMTPKMMHEKNVIYIENDDILDAPSDIGENQDQGKVQ